MRQWLQQEVLTAPLAPVLHPSRLRMRGLGLFTIVVHALSWFAWAVWLPQPYENLPLRLMAASLGLLLLAGRLPDEPTSRMSGQVFTAVLWIELPFFFSWMYLCNAGSPVWLASMAAMIVAYFFATDWRLAALGIVSGGLSASLLFGWIGPAVPPMPPDMSWTHALVLLACSSVGLLLGVSCANPRREQMAQTLATMQVVAHELRTPLATLALIGDAVRGCATDGGAAKVEQLAARLHMLVRNMNHEIDMQITNARPGVRMRVETVSAADLVRSAIANYPFRTTHEKECVRVRVHADFTFRGSHALFSRVVDNLVKNALRSLAAAGASLQPGDLAIEVGTHQGRGRIIVADRGVGIEEELQCRVFEPFFSASRIGGVGLGLAFSRQVIQAAQGTIRVHSTPGHGALFTIELPPAGYA
jgi:two-component system, CAI-1 autoinducer sensor kinase/phosphatase CqsS